MRGLKRRRIPRMLVEVDDVQCADLTDPDKPPVVANSSTG